MTKTSTTKTTKKDQPYSSKLQGVAALLGEGAYSRETSGKNNSSPEISQESETTQNTPTSIAIAKIQLPPSQPRRYFDPQKLEELSHSIKELGILEPLLVRPVTGGNYELVAGERRYKAAQLAGLTEVPVVIREMDDVTTSKVQIVENLQREDLNPIEETEGILNLLALRLEISVEETVKLLQKMDNEAKGKITRNVTGSSQALLVEELFDALGRMKWDSFVRNRLPLLNLPKDILALLRDGKIEYTKARAIAQVKQTSERQDILSEAINNSLSLEEIKALVKKYQRTYSPPPLKSEYKELSKKLGTSKIWENPKKQKTLEKLLNQIKQLLDEETTAK
ncbi:MAG: ParB/RepB/Spo0J family partition protein [Calothrix sp. CSU_2_0]|nr:ParB/RepB/Spo0J family partition protein [Calothrix sp. CSU_2_0]